MKGKKQTLLILLALFCTYFIWGATYLAIRFGIESFPPFLMAGMRFTIAGAVLYFILRGLGAQNPTRQQWAGAGVVGLLLPALGNGTVCYVQQTVSSSVAALSIATAPIWMAVFSVFWGHKITVKEWMGIAIGFVGILLLNIGGSLQGNFMGALLLIFAAASWSFGSVWGKHLPMPAGMMASATQMLIGGVVLLLMGMLQGEVWPQAVSLKSWLALLFLIVLGSMVAYSAYQYLLKTVRPLVASSNTFVNPVVAFILGMGFASERIAFIEFIALGIILFGVFLVLSASREVN